MADLSHLSNDQILALANGKGDGPDLSHVSDSDLLHIAKTGEPPAMSTGDAAKIKFQEGAALGLRPVVAGLGAAAGNLAGQWERGKGINFGEAKDAFLSGRSGANEEQNKASEDHPYVSTAANLGGSLVTLPFLPAKGLTGAVKLGAGLGAAQAAGSANSLKEAATDVGGGAAMGGVAYGAGKALGAGANAISNSEIGKKIGSAFGGAGSKIASAMTGVPDKEIETYAKQYDKVADLIEKSGGRIPVAAEIQKENIQAAVKATKSALNNQISEALQNASPEKNIDVSPIVQRLEEYKGRLNPSLHPEHIKDIDQIIGRVSAAAPDGVTNVQTLQQIKSFLQDQASGTFEGSPLGFQVGKEGANAAKDGFMQAKRIMDSVGPAETKNANRQLFQIHKIEDRINRNLLLPGKSDSALMAVGSGAQNRDALALQRLGNVSGKDFVGDASVLASANRFNNPSWSPAYGTGKALLPGVIGGGIGALSDSEHRGQGFAIGAGIGAALASPAALKLAIDTGRISGRALGAVGNALRINPQNVGLLFHALQTPQAQEILIRSMLDDNQAAAKETPKMSTTIRSRSELKK